MVPTSEMGWITNISPLKLFVKITSKGNRGQVKEFTLCDLSNVTRVPMLPDDTFGQMNGNLEWSVN